MEMIIHEYDAPEVSVADEVTRDGRPPHLLTASGSTVTVPLVPIMVLANAHTDYDIHPSAIPVFRRIAKDRVEAWTPAEGWLFDAKGKAVADVQVPRRDGTGADWFGAFLPDGEWITTDLWENDQQLNAFSPLGTLQWELDGKRVLQGLKPRENDGEPQIIHPSIGWARADRTSHRWLVSLGTEADRAFALVRPDGKFSLLGDNPHLWQLVYPRSMGVRGFYISLYTESDDAAASVHRDEAGHGVEVGWPRYDISDHQLILREGDEAFGFWPGSHALYLERRGSDANAPEVWLFNAGGGYLGQIEGTYLGDSADDKSLLVLASDQTRVLRVAPDGPGIRGSRAFTWPDGAAAIPLAMYDDLKLGFFLRGPQITDLTDVGRRARKAADVVLARW